MIKRQITGLVACCFLVSFGPPLLAQTLSTTDITTTTTKTTTTKSKPFLKFQPTKKDKTTTQIKNVTGITSIPSKGIAQKSTSLGISSTGVFKLAPFGVTTTPRTTLELESLLITNPDVTKTIIKLKLVPTGLETTITTPKQQEGDSYYVTHESPSGFRRR